MPAPWIRSLLLVATAALAACDSPVSPDDGPGGGLALEVHAAGQSLEQPPGGGLPRIQCGFRIVVQAPRRTAVRLRDGVFLWYAGVDTLQAVDSVAVPLSELERAFGSLDVAPGGRLEGEWQLQGAVPFHGRLRLRHGSAAAPGVAEARVRCVPLPETAAGAPPRITALEIWPRGELQPGDTFHVSVATRSDVGLWLTAVIAEGAEPSSAFLAGQLGKEQSHVYRFVVASDAPLDRPVRVEAYVFDGLGREGPPGEGATGTVVDRTPPDLFSAWTPNPQGTDRGIIGWYAPGDSVNVRVIAFDNHVLDSLVYQMDPPTGWRGSLAFGPRRSPPVPMGTGPIPVVPEMVGARALRVHVRDVAGNPSRSVTSVADSFGIYPEVPATIRTARVPVRGGVVFDGPRRRLFLLSEDRPEVRVFSLDAMAEVRTVPLPGVPSGADVVPGGDTLLVALQGLNTIAVVDLARPADAHERLAITVEPAERQRIRDLRVLADGTVLGVLGATVNGRDELMEMDLATGAQRLRAVSRHPGFNSGHYTLVRTADHRVATLLNHGCVHRIDPRTREIAPCRLPTTEPIYRAPSLSASGDRLLAASTVSDAEARPIREFWVPNRLGAEAIAPDGEHVYFGQRGGVARARLTDGRYLERYPHRFPVLTFPTHLFVSEDERMLVVLAPHADGMEIVRMIRP